MIIHNKPFEENLRLVALHIAQAGEKYKDLDLHQLAQDLDFLINSRASRESRESRETDFERGYDSGYSEGYEAAREEIRDMI